MGIVYKGHDPEIDRTVAIKTVHFDASLPPEHQETLKKRFFQEVRAVGKLLHPSIATIFDVGSYEGTNFFTMEYVEGKTFQDVIAARPSLENSISYIIQAAEALHYAHQQGVIHRDIKPANLMVLNDGRVKIMDFGIAKVTQEASSSPEMATQAGFIMGTPNYMSPEQITGKRIDGRSDIFSLAVILYEFLTGKKPFFDENMSAILFKIVNEDPVEPMKVRGNISGVLNEIVMKALKKKPDDRYVDGQEFATALRNFQSRGTAGAVDPFTKEFGQPESVLVQLLSSNCYAFENFTDEEFSEIFKICQKHQFKPGEVIFKENTIRSGLFVIISGKVEVYQEIAGRKIVLSTAENGHCFGEMSLIKQFPSTTFASSLANSFVISINEKSLKSVGAAIYFKVFRNIAVGLLNKVIKCDQKVGELIKNNLEGGA